MIHDLGRDNYFLERGKRHEPLNEMGKLNIKHFCSSKTLLRKWESQPPTGETIEKHISDKRLTSE
jgi:hypothetical protein